MFLLHMIKQKLKFFIVIIWNKQGEKRFYDNSDRKGGFNTCCTSPFTNCWMSSETLSALSLNQPNSALRLIVACQRFFTALSVLKEKNIKHRRVSVIPRLNSFMFCSLPNHSITETHPHWLQTSLSHGHYTWWHSQVLRQLAIILERKRVTTHALPSPIPGFPSSSPFVKAGQNPVKPSVRAETTLLGTTRNWKLTWVRNSFLPVTRDL